MKGKIDWKKIIIAGLLLNVGYILISQQINISHINQEVASTKERIQDVSQKNKQLQEDLEMSSKDAYLEIMARKEGNLLKEGEIPILEKKPKK